MPSVPTAHARLNVPIPQKPPEWCEWPDAGAEKLSMRRTDAAPTTAASLAGEYRLYV